MEENKKEMTVVDSKMRKLQKGDMIIMPQTVKEVQDFVVAVKDAVSIPKELNKQDIFAIIVKGGEMGIPPMAALNNLFLIYGKMSMYTDFAMGLIRNHPEYGGMELKEIRTRDGSFEGYECTMRRRISNSGVPLVDTVTASFTLTDARLRGLEKRNPSYRSMPKIMCRKRVSSQVARELFSDVLQGVYTREEMDDFAVTEPVHKEEGTDFVVMEDEPCEIVEAEEIQAEEIPDTPKLSPLEQKIADVVKAYKEARKLLPTEFTNAYCIELNEGMLGVKKVQDSDDIDKLDELLNILQDTIDRYNNEVGEL